MKKFMELALEYANEAFINNEVPIGAVVVLNNQVVGYGYNMRESTNDITSHAEINAIKQAAQTLGSWKLNECEIYVTIKPCLMCYSAIEQSRIKTIYYGSDQYKFKGKSFDTWIINKNIQVIGPIHEEQCKKLMKTFFEGKRNERKI